MFVKKLFFRLNTTWKTNFTCPNNVTILPVIYLYEMSKLELSMTQCIIVLIINFYLNCLKNIKYLYVFQN